MNNNDIIQDEKKFIQACKDGDKEILLSLLSKGINKEVVSSI